MGKFIFITTCRDIKNPESFEREMRLYEMYTGGVYSLRAELMYQFVDRFYISSLLHFGIVRDDFVGGGYDAPTTGLKQRMKEKDFCSNHRKLFDERYPGVSSDIDTIYFLGNAKYNEAIKQIFPDKNVIICIEQKLRAGAFRSILTKTLRYIKRIKCEYKSEYYEYKGWLFEIRSTGKEKSHHIYKVSDDKYIEINPFKDSTNFMDKFRELTGNLSTKEYVNAVLPDSTFYELMFTTVKKYFKVVLGLTPLTYIDEDRFVRYDFISDGPYNKEFADFIKEKTK